MSQKASSLPSGTKREILSQIREQIGPAQYEQLVNKLGEEGLIDFVLEKTMEAQPTPTKRISSWIPGLILGVVIGGIFIGASWLLNSSLSVPYWYSLATLINGAAITLIISVLAGNADNRKFDFRTVLWCYALVALIGGALGAGRWLQHSDFSLFTYLSNLNNKYGDTIWNYFLGVACVGGILAGIFTLSFGSMENVFASIFTLGIFIMFIIWLVLGLIVIIVDAPLLTPWFLGNVSGFSLFINSHPFLVVLGLMAIIGGLVGKLLPPKIQTV